MKLHHYNQMMAHLTRRQKFAFGGVSSNDTILPKPNPLSPQERNQKVFNDYVGRMKHYLTGADMPEWFVKDLIFKKADELGIELKAGGGRIGGGIIAGKDLGDRTGFVDPNLVRKQKSLQSYYDIFGKELLDKISKKKHGKVFSKLEGDPLSNLKTHTLTKHKDFILKNKRVPTEFEARSLGWTKSRHLSDQAIQIKLVEDLKSGRVDVNELAKKYKIPVEELKTHAKRLERNVWKKRMGTQPLQWLVDEGDKLDNVMNSLYKSKLVQYKRDKIQHLFYDAFGDKKSKTYNPKKWAAMRKNWNEYNKLRNNIKKIFPGIKFELDHPLSKSMLRTIFKASGDQLTRVNPMIGELNNGFKKSLDKHYKNAIANKNLAGKKAIEKIARDLKINIGSVSSDIKKYNFKINQFQNLNMSDELIRAVEQQSNLAKNLSNYVTNNSELFKTAGINTQTIKPVTPIDDTTIKEIKKILSVKDKTKLSSTIQSIVNKQNSGLNIVDIAKWGSAELSVLDEIAGKIPSKALGAFGKLLKVAGLASLPLDAIPFIQARDLGIENWAEVGGKNWVQEFQKLPRTLEDLLHVAGEGTFEKFGDKAEEDRLFTYEPSTWGDKSTAKALRETSVEDIIKNITAQAEDAKKMHVGQQIDTTWKEGELEKRIQKALELKKYYDSNPDVLAEKEEVKDIEATESTATGIEPSWTGADEKEEVVTENKPIYGPIYADQIKKLEV